MQPPTQRWYLNSWKSNPKHERASNFFTQPFGKVPIGRVIMLHGTLVRFSLSLVLVFASGASLKSCFHRRVPTRILNAGMEAPAIGRFEAIQKDVNEALSEKVQSGKAPEKFVEVVRTFVNEYAQTYQCANEAPERYQYFVTTLLKFVQESLNSPYKFKPFHTAIREPFDYYEWGNEFMKPLIDMSQSRMVGTENIEAIERLTSRGDNVIILANHQTEVDPQAISILLQQVGKEVLAEKIIYIAGHKVTTDPVAIPFSMGRNLICIHSKKHIKSPPEDFPMKQQQNMDSMKCMGDLISDGGNVIWLAPSGGRDRPDKSGKFVVAPFDYKSLDMFKLMAIQSGKPLHFFPMAMYTHRLVPPPDAQATAEVGESRSAKRGPISIAWLPETDGLGSLKDKEFSEKIEKSVIMAYNKLCEWHDAS